jgi:hypothetical protein
MSLLPASTVRTLRPRVVSSASQRASSALASAIPGPVPVPAPAPAPLPGKTHDLDVIGPRKLIRPTLPDSARRNRRFQRQDQPTLIVGSGVAHAARAQESSHAESFYLQKQVQAQTPMIFVLEDGEKIDGCIEWYDRNAIKVRCTASPFRNNRSSDAATRALIYKSSIKYLYKAGENSSQP